MDIDRAEPLPELMDIDRAILYCIDRCGRFVAHLSQRLTR